jgi:hypothetical protein
MALVSPPLFLSRRPKNSPKVFSFFARQVKQ